jgi:hypothetical protein
MTVQTTTVDAAITYLVAAATTAFPTAVVFDGPFTVADQGAYQDIVAIGWDLNEENLGAEAVIGDQNFNALNRGVTRDEDYQIVCAVRHWDGDNDVAKARAGARALLTTFERLLRGYPPNGAGDITLGGAVLWAHLAGGFSWVYEPDDNGTAVRIPFHVTCHARLTGA